jgi:hypothetical protein
MSTTRKTSDINKKFFRAQFGRGDNAKLPESFVAAGTEICMRAGIINENFGNMPSMVATNTESGLKILTDTKTQASQQALIAFNSRYQQLKKESESIFAAVDTLKKGFSITELLKRIQSLADDIIQSSDPEVRAKSQPILNELNQMMSKLQQTSKEQERLGTIIRTKIVPTSKGLENDVNNNPIVMNDRVANYGQGSSIAIPKNIANE